MKKSVLSLAGAVAVGTVVLALIGSSSAVADPSTSGRTYSAVGSDTIQDVWNGLSNGYTVSGTSVAAAAGDVASYNAFPAKQNITVNGVTFSRPTGSGAGVKALSASNNPANHNYVDDNGVTVDLTNKIQFARSSGGPSVTGSVLTFVPFARDAVSVAVKTTAGAVTATTAELTNVFSCATGATVNIAGVATAVKPVLPQASSGTRAFFLKAIGLTESTVGACVKTRGEENKGSLFAASNEIAPFSVGQWIAQNKQTDGLANTTSGLALATLNTQAPLDANGNPGALYGSSSVVPSSGTGVFARDTYNVIATTQAVSGNALYTLLQNVRSAQAVTDFGFKALSYTGTTGEKTSGYTN